MIDKQDVHPQIAQDYLSREHPYWIVPEVNYMQSLVKLAQLQFGSGHLFAWMKTKVRAKMMLRSEGTNRGELCFQDDGHTVRIDSIANIVHLARFVGVDHLPAIENDPFEFAKIIAFFVRGHRCYAIDGERDSYYREQLGFGTSVLKDVPSIEPNVKNGIHICFVWERDDAKELELLFRLTTRLSDMSVSQEELARWKGCPRI